MSHPRAVALAAALAMLVFGAPALAQVPEAAGTWQALAPLPQPRSEVCMATDGSRLYLAGGFGGPGS